MSLLSAMSFILIISCPSLSDIEESESIKCSKYLITSIKEYREDSTCHSSSSVSMFFSISSINNVDSNSLPDVDAHDD